MEPRNIKATLIESYNHHAQERDGYSIDEWKVQERFAFLARLKQETKRSLLEIGAGAGKDSKFFSENGLDVLCVDLSPAMVRLCQQKGLDAREMDASHLHFPPGSFDAVYSFNSFLHIPADEFDTALKNVRDVLKPNGLFYLGLYGGKEFEGIWEKDAYTPKRFFSFRTDEHLLQWVSNFFDLISFKPIEIERDDLHFQSCTLRRTLDK